LVRLNSENQGVQCLRCTASTIHLSLGYARSSAIPDIELVDAREFSSVGPSAKFLGRRAKSAALSEFVEGAAPGEMRNGVRCGDMQGFSHEDSSFDLVTHESAVAPSKMRQKDF
jgi:hypothetical protein